MSNSNQDQPDPDAMMRRLEEMVRDAANAPDMMGAAIETVAGMHARWYFAWQAHGVPEPRAAEWAAEMVSALFGSAP